MSWARISLVSFKVVIGIVAGGGPHHAITGDFRQDGCCSNREGRRVAPNDGVNSTLACLSGSNKVPVPV